jgi:tRNA(Ile)-lysidine synthase
VVARLCKNAVYFRQHYEVLEDQLEEKMRTWCRQEGEVLLIEIEKIKENPHAAFWLFKILHPYGFNSNQMDQIMWLLQNQSGRRVLSDTHILYRNRNALALLPLSELSLLHPAVSLQPFSQLDTVGNTAKGYALSLHEASGYVVKSDYGIAALDADKLQFPLTIRIWENGDRFIPLGMKGFKKVSDFLTDVKTPHWEKERQQVVCSGSHIVWIVGRRIDERYKVSDSTKTVAEVSKK